MRRRAPRSAGWLLLLPPMLAAPAAAKDARASPRPAPTADAPLSPDESLALARALNSGGLTTTDAAPAGAYGTPTLSHERKLSISRSENADGSSTVTVTQPLANTWHAKVGADVDVAADPATTYTPDQPLPGTTADKPSGAAFASLNVAPFATVDARVDPGSKQGKLGATLSHSVPLGDGVALTLRGRYAVSDTMAATDNATTPAPVLSNDQSVQLAIGATGTTLSAGVSADSSDPTPHNTLSADQKVYGPLHVTTAITDAGQPTADKRVTAGFKLTW